MPIAKDIDASLLKELERIPGFSTTKEPLINSIIGCILLPLLSKEGS